MTLIRRAEMTEELEQFMCIILIIGGIFVFISHIMINHYKLEPDLLVSIIFMFSIVYASLSIEFAFQRIT